MKSVIHKILSITMAVLVFLTTTSFLMDAHFCGQSLVDLALFQHAESCGMDHEKPANTCDENISKSDCCSDVQFMNEGQDEAPAAYASLSLDQQLFIISFVFTYHHLFEGLERNFIPFKDYTPPFLIRDFQKIQETYII